MPSYAIDSIGQPMTGTGIVDPQMEWEETPEGSRRPSKDKQARDEATGMPLWQVEVLYVQTSFGRRSTVPAKVTVGSIEEPRVAPMSPIAFTGLRCEVRIAKNGGFVEYWSAESLLEPARASSASSTAKPADGKAA